MIAFVFNMYALNGMLLHSCQDQISGAPPPRQKAKRLMSGESAGHGIGICVDFLFLVLEFLNLFLIYPVYTNVI